MQNSYRIIMLQSFDMIYSQNSQPNPSNQPATRLAATASRINTPASLYANIYDLIYSYTDMEDNI
jgi:hypothetical protein